MTKLIVAFRNFANAPNNDHKTAALNGVRGTCLSFGIAVSAPVEKKNKLGNRHFYEILYTDVFQEFQRISGRVICGNRKYR